MTRIENFVELKVYKIPGRIRKLKEGGKVDPRQMEKTKAWIPPKGDGQGKSHVISRQENEVFQLRERPLNHV